jgi:hypothetical protein
MEILSFSELTLYFEPEEREAALLIRDACEKTVKLAQSLWGLSVPPGCRVYVMTSWLKFVFHAAPWTRKILLALFFPFWAMNARKMWSFAGGWALSYQRPPAAGVKPPRLIAQAANNTMGRRVFVQESDIDVKTQHIACHELTHALTGHLRLPAWMHEGVAMLAVDAFHGQPTVLTETLDALNRVQHKTSPKGYRQLRGAGEDALVYLYVRGYWITRYFAEAHPDVLKAVLSHRHRPNELMQTLSAAVEVGSDQFWQEIDDVVLRYFIS